MSRTIATFGAIGLVSLLIAGRALAQVFAQAAAEAEAPRTADSAPAAARVVQGAAALAAPAPAGGVGFVQVGGPAAAPPAPGAAPATPRLPTAPVPVPPQAGGFIRAVGPGGGGGVVYQAGPGWGSGMGGFGLGHGEDDPEMAKLIQSEHELDRQSDDLVKQYGGTEDYTQREKLRTQLRELLVKQFDAQQLRREKELERVEKRISDLRAQIKKRTSVRNDIVDRRLENLTSDADGLGWTTPAGGGPQGLTGGIFGGQPRTRPAVAR